ncbi:putative membrane protein YphA (DoxX/SURF4 family) [Pseudarthrobacter siccitolerans]|uniref:Membrane protein YphA (DoxX/SURF4 family) n=1 Tax=Pseudarthrobacter siccitolerans TaxID=861266 RepID=A0ABU0PK82_9MICC|nr:DoxX family protein [Pseudarthrobacter siccitolerans]MDQ0674386.1 putative membrane protein YphA (DoxX/SURF4 family) [Pseudarthrobacter siccitolerans]
MNITLWIITAILALAFLAAGTMKIAQPKAKLAAAGQGWVEDFSDATVKRIGALEILAALGLILPALFGIATVLVPAAAVGLVLLMAGAAITHGRRHETPNVVINVVLAILAAGVAIARFGPFGF